MKKYRLIAYIRASTDKQDVDHQRLQILEYSHQHNLKVDDFIISDHLVSLMLTQLSEDADLYPIFQDIFDPEGSEIYLKPIDHYIEIGQPVNFYTVVEAARQRGETAIGYRVAVEANNAEKNHGVHTNPKKSKKVIFAPDDRVIVIAED